ncbi:MAG: hypothetical protein NZU63_04835 [Gemmataceae bacterium]|nr:hypothetical protein [Gemmataceae bacterium]
MAEIPYVLIICIAAVVCLTPLSVYLRIVAAIGQRNRATVVNGVWDFVGLLTGLSGFLLFGGVQFLALLLSHFRLGLRGGFAGLRAGWEQQSTTWTVLAILYIVGLVTWISLVVLSRRRSWVFYNVTSPAVEECIERLLTQLQLNVTRVGNIWYVGDQPVCELEVFERGNTAILRWLHPNKQLYDQFVRLLPYQAATIPPPVDNWAALWLRTASVGLGVFALTCLGLLAYALFWVR